MQTSQAELESRYAGRHRIVDHSAPAVAGYEVLEPIGQGGSGAVWSAANTAGETVAIKVVPAVDSADALVELAVLGRIADPHLVRLHEAVALPGGDIALVLDHVAGGTLGAAVRARGHLTPGEAVTVLSPIASTVGRLHAMGVVHGDVSPDNVLLDLDGRPFLADLGVARIVGEQLAELRGTEGFVAPEVAVGGVPTPASDTYALGALAWFALTGDAPGPAVIRGRLGERFAALPEELVSAVEGALRSRPEDRPDVDALALSFFESAEPQPLVLVRGGDDVSLLTRRIRAAARSAAVDGASGAPPSHESAGHRARDLVRRRVGTGLAMPRVSFTRMGSSALRVLRTLAPFAAVVAVMATVAFGVIAWSSGRDDARASTATDRQSGATDSSGTGRDSDASSVGPSAAAGAGGADPSAIPASDPRLSKDAPRSDPRALVEALARARAAAWSSGIAAKLVEVDAARSPALARDTEVLAGVQRANQRYVGLAFVVRDAEFVSEAQGLATVRARIDTGAHVVRGAGGDQRRPAVAAQPVLLDLVHTDSGWRVHDVRAD